MDNPNYTNWSDPPPIYTAVDPNPTGFSAASVQQAMNDAQMGAGRNYPLGQMSGGQAGDASAPTLINMEEQQRQLLVLLLHAYICREREKQRTDVPPCKVPLCGTFKTILTHIAGPCTEGKNCRVVGLYCPSSRRVLTHWNKCRRFDCPICGLYKRRNAGEQAMRVSNNTNQSDPPPMYSSVDPGKLSQVIIDGRRAYISSSAVAQIASTARPVHFTDLPDPVWPEPPGPRRGNGTWTTMRVNNRVAYVPCNYLCHSGTFLAIIVMVINPCLGGIGLVLGMMAVAATTMDSGGAKARKLARYSNIASMLTITITIVVIIYIVTIFVV